MFMYVLTLLLVLCFKGDGLPDMATQDEVLKALESVGFEVQSPRVTFKPS